MEKLIEFFKTKSVGSALDIGTGTGDFIPVLKSALPHATITGVDPNPESLAKAQGKYPEASFKEMTGEKLLYPDNTFDLVSISMALHHLPDIKKAFDEMKRVVKPGGWIIVNELFCDNLAPAQEVHKQYHHFRSTIDRLTRVSHNATFCKQEILDFVADSDIPILFDFEFRKEGSVIRSPEDIQERVTKMKIMLEKIKDRPEYGELSAEIEIFSQNAKRFGFEMATRVVVVGSVN